MEVRLQNRLWSHLPDVVRFDIWLPVCAHDVVRIGFIFRPLSTSLRIGMYPIYRCYFLGALWQHSSSATCPSIAELVQKPPYNGADAVPSWLSCAGAHILKIMPSLLGCCPTHPSGADTSASRTVYLQIMSNLGNDRLIQCWINTVPGCRQSPL